jgi:hypothetical protein
MKSTKSTEVVNPRAAVKGDIAIPTMEETLSKLHATEKIEPKAYDGPKRKKVAILGTVPHKLMAPFNNDEFEIWAIAHACLGDPLPRVTRIFEIHKWDEVVKWGSPQAWAKHNDVPVYLIEAREDVPQSVAFPFDRIAKQFKIFNDREECMMTNSISWMIGLAIDEGFDEIHVYGVNMSHSSEYGFQKPSCEYYLGLAKGMGKTVYVPTESDLCKSFYLYGKDEEKQTDMMKKLENHFAFIQNMHNQYLNNKEVSRDNIHKFIGAIEQWKNADTDQNDPKVKERIENLTAEYQKHVQMFEQSRDAVNQHIGAMELMKYIMLLMKQ